MKKLSIILACALVAFSACTKSKEVHPEIGDGNDEIVTVGKNDVHVKYARTDHAELNRVVFHYCPADANGNAQQFEFVEMTKKETFFELTLNDLLSDTLYWYYYELFPNGGTSTNTSPKTFRTQVYDTPEPPTPPTPPSGAPEGAINGLFTINENGDQVYFSQGNLQYQASTNTWRFAEHQWDFVGGVNELGMEYGNVYENGNKCDNLLISSLYDGWIDLFGWGTSGYHEMSDQFNVFYHPWDSESITINPECNMCGYGPSTNMPSTSLIGSSSNYDWGVYNAIINGGNVANKWRTLCKEEWEYIFDRRHTNSGERYAKSRVCGLDGVIILPDNWEASNYNLSNTNVGDASFDSNEITLSVWDESFERAGAVFLPASGCRYRLSDIFYEGKTANYWSSSDCIFMGGTSDYSGVTAFCVYVLDDFFYASGNVARDLGRSVRLVQDVR